MKVQIHSVHEAALQIAREQSFRIHPDLFKQYITGRLGGMKKVPESIRRETVYRWVEAYEDSFNRPAPVAVRIEDDANWPHRQMRTVYRGIATY